MKSRFKILVLISVLLGIAHSYAEDKLFSLPTSGEGLPGEGPIRQEDWYRDKWKERRTEFASLVHRDQGAVVFLGDSLTEGWGSALWAAFPEMQVANRGISGDITRGVLIRLEEDVLGLEPAAIVLLIGSNDLDIGLEPEAVARNLKLILDSIKSHNRRTPVILCEVFPSSSSRNRPADKIQKLNKLYMKLAKGNKQIIYMETYDLFADENGDAKLSEFTDLLHPNEVGYAKWAAALRPIFATYWFREDKHAFVLEEGYQSLFNGTTLNGWSYRPTTDEDIRAAENWRKADPEGAADWPIVKRGAIFNGMSRTPDGRFFATYGRLIVTTPKEIRKIQQLWTQQEFDQDFTLKLEFRATPNADSGIYIRGPQLQCRDYALAGPWKELKNYKPQEWNEIVVTVKGNVAHCVCNGEVLIDALEIPDSGPIGLEGDRGQVEYRNIRIKIHE